MKQNIKLIVESLFDDIDMNSSDTDMISDTIAKNHVKKLLSGDNIFKNMSKLNNGDIDILLTIKIPVKSIVELCEFICGSYVHKITDLNFIDTSNITSLHNFSNILLNRASDHRIKDEALLEYTKDIDISGWDVSNVTDMSYAFSYLLFNCDLNDWDVSKVKDMHGTFYRCDNFNGNISNWDVSNVITMEHMFMWCKNFNQDISRWDVSNVRNMDLMFSNCHKFNQNIGNWDVSNVTVVSEMFYNCKEFNQNLNNWYFSKWTTYFNMFKYADSFNINNISSWQYDIHELGFK